MSEIAIKIENLSKQYRLGTVGSQTLKGDLQRLWWKIKGKGDPFLQIGQENKLDNVDGEYVWALNDINLEINEGEVVGIIGKNGAGKSTLLKIISRITNPTTGNIKVKGRIASLLEVGTGFHPELTGRENIYLNGAILGMTKAEINRKFDDIVDFAGIAKYIDTPVKRYSSGMYVRLGFAVAAHLDPEILIVDEVLAVGDAEFQKRAIGKMQDISKGGGRTVLFVSHNMASVKALCNSGVLLENGKIKNLGDINNIVDSYLKGDFSISNHKKGNPLLSFPDIDVYEVGVKANNKDFDDIINIEDEIVFFTKYKHKNPDKEIHITIHLKDELGNVVFTNGSFRNFDNKKTGMFEVNVTFPDNFFNWGTFNIDLFIIQNRRSAIHVERDILSFNIVNPKKALGEWMGKEAGAIHPKFEWNKLNLANE